MKGPDFQGVRLEIPDTSTETVLAVANLDSVAPIRKVATLWTRNDVIPYKEDPVGYHIDCAWQHVAPFSIAYNEARLVNGELRYSYYLHRNTPKGYVSPRTAYFWTTADHYQIHDEAHGLVYTQFHKPTRALLEGLEDLSATSFVKMLKGYHLEWMQMFFTGPGSADEQRVILTINQPNKLPGLVLTKDTCRIRVLNGAYLLMPRSIFEQNGPLVQAFREIQTDIARGK